MHSILFLHQEESAKEFDRNSLKCFPGLTWGIAAFGPFSRLRFSTFLGSDLFFLTPKMHLTLVTDALLCRKALLEDGRTAVQVAGWLSCDRCIRAAIAIIFCLWM